MPDIVLTTLNAKYIHASFGLRYLMANLGELRPCACLAEFDINQRPLEVVESLLSRDPKIIGFGVYIWNVRESEAVISVLRKLRPDIRIVIGGPEVSHEVHGQVIVELADHVITGEADLKFAEVCKRILEGGPPMEKIIHAPIPELSALALPYDGYDAEDIAHRVIYVEASRGCPFTCEFCLSSLDVPVRAVDLERFLRALDGLIERGATQFKFVDRTFNLNLRVSRAILEFCLERYRPGMFFHFEMVPDRLPEGLRDLVKRFPSGSLQFEVGIQTFNLDVAGLISRRQKYDALEENFRFLRRETGVHVHADLIVGLPGESLESFGEGFDRLVGLEPQEIQVGILKRLRGTPIVRHDEAWRMVYADEPPYEILSTRLIPFKDMQRMRRYARYWDLVGNSGNFVATTPLLWRQSGSPFAGFLKWSDWLFARTQRTHGIALIKLMRLLLEYLRDEVGVAADEAARCLLSDYRRTGRGDTPKFVGALVSGEQLEAVASQNLPKRQKRHLTHSG